MKNIDIIEIYEFMEDLIIKLEKNEEPKNFSLINNKGNLILKNILDDKSEVFLMLNTNLTEYEFLLGLKIDYYYLYTNLNHLHTIYNFNSFEKKIIESLFESLCESINYKEFKNKMDYELICFDGKENFIIQDKSKEFYFYNQSLDYIVPIPFIPEYINSSTFKQVI